MGAMKRKLHSRSGATLLMALLLLLVAVMVSTVIISAANTATSSLKTRRDNQQAYLTVSSAAEYLRDSLLEEEGYSRSFIRYYWGDPDNETKFDHEASGPATDRQHKSIAETVDRLLAQVMAGPTSAKPFVSGVTPTQTYVLRYGDLAPVTMVLTLKEERDESTVEQDSQSRRYLLTAEFSTEEGSDALCRMTLQMYCEVNRDTVTNGNDKTKTLTYRAAWNKDAAVILRQGMLEEETP